MLINGGVWRWSEPRCEVQLAWCAERAGLADEDFKADYEDFKGVTINVAGVGEVDCSDQMSSEVNAQFLAHLL